MPKTTITFKEDFKSFKKDFAYEFKGNLIIISGINGSGKSQLLTATHELNQNQKLKAETRIDDILIVKSEILLKQLKDSNNFTPKLNESNAAFYTLIRNEVRNLIQALKQTYQHKKQNPQYYENSLNSILGQGLFTNAKKRITDLLGEEKIVATKDEDFDSLIDSIENLALIWQPDDFFTPDNLTDTFLAYLIARQEFETNEYKKGERFGRKYEDKSPPPWTQLNNLFKKLKFSYRFAKDYEINSGNTIKGSVRLLNDKQESVGFDIGDLSDGEKAIFSIALASMRSEISRTQPKLLLLDEYDATLNPSLTEALFTILKDFFLSKGTVVIIATHSPATISLTPDSATFYEIFKPQEDELRIIKVSREQYAEMQIANKGFYEKIKDSNQRIKELNDENARIDELLKQSKEKPVLIVEGKTDKTILETAWDKLYPNQTLSISIIDAEGADKMHVPTNTDWIASLVNKIIFLNDYDDKGLEVSGRIKSAGEKLKEDDSFDRCKVKSNKNKKFYSVLLPIPSFRRDYIEPCNTKNMLTIEHLFPDDEIRSYSQEKKYFGDRVTLMEVNDRTGNKTKFADSVKNLDPSRFEEFKPLFETILKIIS